MPESVETQLYPSSVPPPKPPTQRRSFWVVMGVAFRASPVQLMALLILEPLGISSTLLVALWLKLLTDAILAGKLGFAMAWAFLIGATWTLFYALFLVGFNIRRTVSEKVSNHIDVLISELTAGIFGVEHLERPDYLDKIELLRRDQQGIGNVVNQLVFNARSAVSLVVSVLLLTTVHPALALLPLIGIVPMMLNGRQQTRSRRHEEETAPLARLDRHLFDVGSNPAIGKELRVFSLKEEISRRHSETWGKRERLAGRVAWKNNAEGFVGDVIFTVSFVAAAIFTVLQAQERGATAGDVIMVLTLAQSATGALQQFVGNLRGLSNYLRTAERFVWLKDYANSARNMDSGSLSPPERFARGIVVRDVSFTYPTSDSAALKDVSLELPAGKVVALVGENGAGKTTLVKLLTKMYLPSSGVIELDGTDLRSIDTLAWRQRVGSAFQDFVRFELSVKQSIGVGDFPRMDDSSLIADAAERGGATAVIAKLPHGLETQLGRQWEDGVELSGGEWQRFALARGLMRKDPLLVVLDEPTSSLDAETEAGLFRRFTAEAERQQTAGAVTLFVSHRFSTVRAADLIVVMDKGQVVERGTHDELMNTAGLYAELFTIQAEAYS